MAKTENGMNRRQFERRGGRRGFTLIELLVVVAIIALLISILLPSLSGARASAKAAVCASNLGQVGKAVGIYLAENNAYYPMSYVYARDGLGGYDLQDQDPNRPFGYVHWSFFLYGRGQVDTAAFECPEIPNGGHPRTNPGPVGANWEGGQADDGGSTSPSPNSIEDKQAERVAFSGNAAIFPRNKFNQGNQLPAEGDGNARNNVLVNETNVKSSGRPVILATEFQKKFSSVCTVSTGNGNARLSKSHRPINPFRHIGSGSNEYSVNTLGFTYKTNPNNPDTPEEFGLLPQSQIADVAGLIEGAPNNETEINAVGRHHPGGDKLGGSTNFLYIDGSSQRKAVLQTLINREWGTRYYSISGRNEVLEFLPPS